MVIVNCLVLAKVTEVLGANIYYPCCQHCNSKIFQVENGWLCSKCSSKICEETLQHRYRVSFSISDSKSQCSVTVFGTTLNSFMGCSANGFHRWLQETGCNEDVLKASLNETFVGNMFLFGFKVKSTGKGSSRNALLSLDDVARRRVIFAEEKSKTGSLIAYQMLYPSDAIQQDSKTVLHRLQFHRIIASGRLPKQDSCLERATDSFMLPRNSRDSRSFLVTANDGQESIQLSCGSFSRTTFELTKNDSSVTNPSCRKSYLSERKENSDINFDSQPSIEIPRSSKHSLSSTNIENFTEMNDVPLVAEQSQEDDCSIYRKLDDESAHDQMTPCRTDHEREESQVPVFRFCMREESMSDSILLQANELKFTDTHSSENKSMNANSSTNNITEHWTCIPESEELGDFLDQVEENDLSTASHVPSELKEKVENFASSNSNVTSATCYPMSEDLDAFLWEVEESEQQGSQRDFKSSVERQNAKEASAKMLVIQESEETEVEAITTKQDCSAQMKNSARQVDSSETENSEVLTSNAKSKDLEINKTASENDDSLWDDEVLSQNLLNAINGLDLQSEKRPEHPETKCERSCVLVESEDLFASFSEECPDSMDDNNHEHSSYDTPLDAEGPTVILNTTSAKKGVRFAKSLLQSQTLDHIDHLMETTPLSNTPIARRNSCLKVKPSNKLDSPYCPGSPDLSQDLFSPSPIPLAVSRTKTQPLLLLQTKLLYQSTPSHKLGSVTEVPDSSDQFCESPSNSASDSMDLFSDSSFASSKKSTFKNASHSQDLFSDDSFCEQNLCKKLF